MPIKIPAGPKTYTVEFPRLDGGLNLWELDYRMDDNQSPEMQNLIWKDGALGCRDGQTWLSDDDELGVGYACSNEFSSKLYFHIGSKIYSCVPTASPVVMTEVLNLETLYGAGYVASRGVFFEYDGALYYKANGVYVICTGTPGKVPAYTPIIMINGVPSDGSGDLYQPENRYSAAKTVKYTGTGSVSSIQLPVTAIDSVDKIVIDGTELTTGFTPDLTSGSIAFTAAITSTTANAIEITYSKANTTAMSSIMTCKYAEVYGGDTNVCVVLGGCTAQQNAYYWSGNHTVMDAGYLPIEHYNFAGDASDGVTGFGKQQGLLVVFKNRSVGKASFGLSTIDGRESITMDYTNINATIGCDLPYTIQLIDNRLVFCNSLRGVHIILDSSSAYENNIVMISRNINGTEKRKGLFYDISQGGITCSADNNEHYIITTNGHSYVWDYVLSAYSEPSWFYFTNINAIGYASTVKNCYHLNANGQVTKFENNFGDYGEAIEKTYRFASQNFGTYERLKDVTGVTLVTRSDTDSAMYINYLTDYAEYSGLEQTPIRAYSWVLFPRNLGYRFLGIQKYATVAHRRPGAKHVRHFSMKLYNNDNSSDMTIISAQVYYRLMGKER